MAATSGNRYPTSLPLRDLSSVRPRPAERERPIAVPLDLEPPTRIGERPTPGRRQHRLVSTGRRAIRHTGLMLVDEHGRQVRIGVYGLAIEDQGDPAILLTRLAADEVDADFWTLPGGGLDWGEHPLDGLKREFIEETGLEPRPLMPLGIHSYSLDSEQRRRPGPSIHVIQAVYLVRPPEPRFTRWVAAPWRQMVPLTELGPVPVVELVNVALALRDALTLGSEPPPPVC